MNSNPQTILKHNSSSKLSKFVQSNYRQLRSGAVYLTPPPLTTHINNTISNSRILNRQMRRQVNPFSDDSSSSLSLHNQQKIFQKTRTILKRQPKAIQPSVKLHSKQRPLPKKVKQKNNQLIKKIITRRKKTPIIIQIDSNQSSNLSEVSIEEIHGKQQKPGRNNPDSQEIHVLSDKDKSSESQSRQAFEARFPLQTIQHLNGEIQSQIPINLAVQIEESIQRQPWINWSSLNNRLQNQTLNSLEQLRELMANQTNIIQPFSGTAPQSIRQRPNQNNRSSNHLPPISSTMAGQNYPVQFFQMPSQLNQNSHPLNMRIPTQQNRTPNTSNNVLLTRNTSISNASRSRRNLYMSETIVIEDSGDEGNNEAILNHMMWFLSKNHQYKSTQLTLQQLQQCDQCSICHQSFIAPEQKVQQTPKTQHNIKVEFVHRNQHQIVNQSSQSKNQVLELFCKHFYHKQCITKWLLSTKPLCPFCRMDFRKHKAYQRWDPQYLRRLDSSGNLNFPVMESWSQEEFEPVYLDLTNRMFEQIFIDRPLLLRGSQRRDDSEINDVFEIPRTQNRVMEVEFLLPGWNEEKQENEFNGSIFKYVYQKTQ